MKKIVCSILSIVLVILLFLNLKPYFIYIDDELLNCIEISDSLLSIYDNIYTEQDIKKMSSTFKESEIVYDSMINLYNTIVNNEYVSLEYLLDVGFSSSILAGEVEIDNLIDTPIYEVEGVQSVKLEDISESHSLIYQGIEYTINWENILTYENIINSLDYSYIFDTAYIEGNNIYCKYQSKGNREPLIVVFEFNILDKLNKISVVE